MAEISIPGYVVVQPDPDVLAPTTSQSSVTQYGITWTFDTTYEVGQFVTGDYFVVAPSGLDITSITPASENDSGWIKSGTMVNPAQILTVQPPGPLPGPYYQRQGFDNQVIYGATEYIYDGSLNVDPGITGTNLTVSAGSSVVKNVSKPTSLPTHNVRPQFLDQSILTVLATTPNADSFRPAMGGTDKTIFGTKSDLNYNILSNLTTPVTAPSIASVMSDKTRHWDEHNPFNHAQLSHPENHQEEYGEVIAYSLADALLVLNLNYTNAEKESLYVWLVQHGIDVWGTINQGSTFKHNGGHNMGRKCSMILAGKALNSTAINNWASGTDHMIFQDDQTMFYVSQTDIDSRDYIQADLGIAEWGQFHYTQPNLDTRSYSAPYRNAASSSQFGTVVAANIMGFESDWDWTACFDYMERWRTWSNVDVGSAHYITQFHADMYDDYWV